MSNVIQIGPLRLPVPILFFLISLGLIYLLTRILKYEKKKRSFITNIVFNGALILFGVWKLSVIFSSFKSVVKNPLALLYLPGSNTALVFGIIAALLYAVLKVYKSNERSAAVKGVVLGVVLALTITTAGSLLFSSFFSMNSQSSRSSLSFYSDEEKHIILKSINGEEIDLSKEDGKITVLNFWASWCPPCKAEIPELNEFLEILSTYSLTDKVSFYTVNLTSSEKNLGDVKKMIDSYGIFFPVLLDSSGAVQQRFFVSSVPTTIIFNSAGMEIKRFQSAVTSSLLLSEVKAALKAEIAE